MSEPERPDDRELEDFLAGRSDISNAYRNETTPETPPPELDARVQATAAVPVERLRRLRRWRRPLKIAASFVVVVGLLRLALQDPALRLPPPSQHTDEAEPAAVVASKPEPTAVAASVSDRPVEASVEIQTESAPRLRADAREASAAQDEARASASDAARKVEAERRADADGARELRARPADDAATSARAGPGLAATAPSAAGAVAALTASGADRAAPVPSSPAAELAAGAAPPPREQSAPAPAFAAKRAAQAPASNDWQPAQYRGLRLGVATLEDMLRRYGSAPSDEVLADAAQSSEGRGQQRVVDYPEHADPRGHLRVYLDADGHRLASVLVTLEPALPLAQVEHEEGLAPPVVIRSAQAPMCAPEPQPAPTEDAPYPQYRVYARQGLVLRLTAADTVAEIGYFEQCR